jgi:protein gp37
LLEDLGEIDLAGIDWVIVGGESGKIKKARPCRLEWIRAIRDQCQAAGVAFFCKQLGTNPVDDDGSRLKLRDRKHGGDWDEWPEDLRIRQFPPATVAVS